jgi:hypothetical protein
LLWIVRTPIVRCPSISNGEEVIAQQILIYIDDDASVVSVLLQASSPTNVTHQNTDSCQHSAEQLRLLLG